MAVINWFWSLIIQLQWNHKCSVVTKESLLASVNWRIKMLYRIKLRMHHPPNEIETCTNFDFFAPAMHRTRSSFCPRVCGEMWWSYFFTNSGTKCNGCAILVALAVNLATPSQSCMILLFIHSVELIIDNVYSYLPLCPGILPTTRHHHRIVAYDIYESHLTWMVRTL